MRSGLALAVFLAPASGQTPDAAAREWSQARGNAEGTAAVDVAPIVSRPEEAWRVELRELAADPVAWGGVLYAVGGPSTARKLHAIEIATGKSAATPVQLAPGSRGHLAAWQGFVAWVEGDGITIFQHRGKQLTASREKKTSGSFPAPPCVAKGYLFACDARGLVQCLDLRTGKKIGAFSGGAGRPTVTADDSTPAADDLLVTTVGSGTPPPPDPGHVYVGSYLALYRERVASLGGKAPVLTAIQTDWEGRFEEEFVGNSELAPAFAAPLSPPRPGAESPWFVYTPQPLAKKSGGAGWRTVMTPSFLSPIATEPAVAGGFACGFSAEGALIRFQSDGSHAFVIPEGDALPAGARRGRATIARGVLYLENWAVEIESGRVLWCTPELDPATPLLPVADGRAVYATKAGAIVCLRDPGAAPGAAGTSGTRAGTARAKPPGSGDGVVTRAGQRLEGRVTELPGGGYRVETKRSGPVDLAAGDVALVERDGQATLVGEELGVHRAFRAVLDAEALDGFAAGLEGYRRAGFLPECQRLLAEARRYDAEGARIGALERTLAAEAGAKGANATAQLERLRREEAAMRASIASSCLVASAWCRERGLRLVASALLRDADLVRPGDARVLAAAAELVPKGFPKADAPNAGARWIELAASILPSGAQVLDRDDPAWERARARPWSAGAIGLATKHLLLFSTEEDAGVLGSCLAHGESALRTFEERLASAGGHGPGRLEVWLHWSRDEYLEEFGAAKRAMEWTAGGFDPQADLSRFYVPRGGGTGNPLERSLHGVLVHELTHHYTFERYRDRAAAVNAGGSKVPGFWLVEGLAEFFEGQVVEMGRRQGQLDDETVESIDASARILAVDKLIPVERILTMTQEDFWKLGTKPFGTVQLRNTVGGVEISEKSVFYSEAGSLAYFLWSRGGTERQTALVAALRDWIGGQGAAEPWARFGYESGAALDAAYRAFLREPGR